jgi:hypothetical protein
MLFVGLLMASVVIDVQVEARRRQRCMPEVVAHEAQVRVPRAGLRLSFVRRGRADIS